MMKIHQVRDDRFQEPMHKFNLLSNKTNTPKYIYLDIMLILSYLSDAVR